MALSFLSHAARDAELARALTHLLQVGCGLRPDEVFCTSVEGSGIGTGELFPASIHAALERADLVILLVTPMWWASPFCVAEAGGAWAMRKRIFPLIVPGVKREMGSNLLGTQTRALDTAGLSDLRDAIIETHPEATRSTPRWTLELQLFTERLPALLKALATPDTVERAELVRAQEQTTAAMGMVREAREQLDAKDRLIEEIRKAKDATEVRAIELAHTGDQAHFDHLVEEATESLRNLSDVAQRALFATVSGHPWRPSSEIWNFQRRDMDAATAKRTIEPDGAGYGANLEHPDVEAAHDAVRALERLLAEASEEFLAHVRATYRVIPDLDNTDFWTTVLRASFIE